MAVLEQEQNNLCHPVLLSPACTGDLEQILMGRDQWLICASASVSLLADVSHAGTRETQDKENWINNKAKL